MARILSISQSEILRTTRQLVLEQAGHQALSMGNLTDHNSFNKEDRFDLAVIGHNFRGEDKRKIAQIINKQFPGLSILELCLHSPEIPGADFMLSDSPDDLIRAVQEILAGRRVRGFLP